MGWRPAEIYVPHTNERMTPSPQRPKIQRCSGVRACRDTVLEFGRPGSYLLQSKTRSLPCGFRFRFRYQFLYQQFSLEIWARLQKFLPSYYRPCRIVLALISDHSEIELCVYVPRVVLQCFI